MDIIWRVVIYLIAPLIALVIIVFAASILSKEEKPHVLPESEVIMSCVKEPDDEMCKEIQLQTQTR